MYANDIKKHKYRKVCTRIGINKPFDAHGVQEDFGCACYGEVEAKYDFPRHSLFGQKTGLYTGQRMRFSINLRAFLCLGLSLAKVLSGLFMMALKIPRGVFIGVFFVYTIPQEHPIVYFEVVCHQNTREQKLFRYGYNGPSHAKRHLQCAQDVLRKTFVQAYTAESRTPVSSNIVQPEIDSGHEEKVVNIR